VTGRVDTIPNNAPIAHSACPILNVACDGLRRPSRPKAVCQARSNGTANARITTP